MAAKLLSGSDWLSCTVYRQQTVRSDGRSDGIYSGGTRNDFSCRQVGHSCKKWPVLQTLQGASVT